MNIKCLCSSFIVGYGDFTGLGNFNNFENTVEQQPPHAHAPMDEGATPQPLSGNGGRRGNNFNLQQVSNFYRVLNLIYYGRCYYYGLYAGVWC